MTGLYILYSCVYKLTNMNYTFFIRDYDLFHDFFHVPGSKICSTYCKLDDRIGNLTKWLTTNKRINITRYTNFS